MKDELQKLLKDYNLGLYTAEEYLTLVANKLDYHILLKHK